MTISLAEIRALDATRWPAPTKLIFDQPPATPATIQVSGERNILRVQWTTVTGVDGYDVAVMTSPNLGAPDVNIVSLSGSKTREYVYQTGNNSLLRYFAVRSSAGGFVSPWSPVVSATSAKLGANDVSGSGTQASTSSTTEVVLKTMTVGGGVLGANDGIQFFAAGQRTVSTAGTATINVRWGGLTGTIIVSTAVSGLNTWQAFGQIFNRNATNSQVGAGLAIVTTTWVNGGITTATLDTAVNQDLVITGQLASAGQTLTCEEAACFVVRGAASSDSAPPSPPGNPPSGDPSIPAGRFFQQS